MVKTIVLRQDPPLCKKTGGPPRLPHLKRWCLVCIAPTLSGVETKKKIQTSLCHFSSNSSLMHTLILKPINFLLIRQVVSCIAPLTPTQGGSLSSTLVMTTYLKNILTCRFSMLENNYFEVYFNL